MVRRPRDAISRSWLSILHETTPPQARFGSSVAERMADGCATDSDLTATRFIRVLSAAAFASLFLPRADWPASDQSWVWAFVVLTLLSIVLEFVAVELPHGGIVSLATITHIATILLVPAPFAAISVGSAVLVEELIHKRPFQRVAFNTSCHVLTISLASFAVSLIGDPRTLVEQHQHLELVTMVIVVSVVYHLVNDVLTSTIMALSTGRPLAYVIRTTGRSTILAEAGAGMIGVLFALIWEIEPIWTAAAGDPRCGHRPVAPVHQPARARDPIGRPEPGRRRRRPGPIDVSTTRPGSPATPWRSPRSSSSTRSSWSSSTRRHRSTTSARSASPTGSCSSPSPLTSDEQLTMWLHTEIGARILRQFNLFRSGAEIVLYHHEAYDGSGYPAGLAGEAIPLGARVVAVADALDAMTSDRPYRDALSLAEAIERFRSGSGRQWDPAIVGATLRLLLDGRLRLDERRRRRAPARRPRSGAEDAA